MIASLRMTLNRRSGIRVGGVEVLAALRGYHPAGGTVAPLSVCFPEMEKCCQEGEMGEIGGSCSGGRRNKLVRHGGVAGWKMV
jgi:hypothetical protein